MQKRLPTRKNRPKNGLLIFGKDEVPGSNPGNSSNKRDVKLTVLRLFCYVSCIYNDFQGFGKRVFQPLGFKKRFHDLPGRTDKSFLLCQIFNPLPDSIQFFFVMRFLPEEMARSGQTSTQRWQPTHFFPSRIGFLASFSRMAWCPPSAHEISQRPQPMHFSR